MRRVADLPAPIRGQVWEISHLYVAPEHRRQGEATRLLESICRQANRLGLALLVEARAYGDTDMSQEQLQRFYAKHGFVSIQASPPLMARAPHFDDYPTD